MGPRFRNRIEAGQELAGHLEAAVGDDSNLLVLALPRGGVPVGFEVARQLHADLDVILIRKLGVPGHEELAMGAIASGGIRVLNHSVIKQLGLSPAIIDLVAARERRAIEVRERLYRDDRPALAVGRRTVILVDDGLATGASMLAAARAARTRHPKRIIVGVPVASREACEELKQHVDDVVCVATPEPFESVGAWYEDFSQTADAEVQELLKRAA